MIAWNNFNIKSCFFLCIYIYKSSYTSISPLDWAPNVGRSRAPITDIRCRSFHANRGNSSKSCLTTTPSSSKHIIPILRILIPPFPSHLDSSDSSQCLLVPPPPHHIFIPFLFTSFPSSSPSPLDLFWSPSQPIITTAALLLSGLASMNDLQPYKLCNQFHYFFVPLRLVLICLSHSKPWWRRITCINGPTLPTPPSQPRKKMRTKWILEMMQKIKIPRQRSFTPYAKYKYSR